jgi:ABC-type antimicrobial peptide transport system permease subunit
LLLFLAASLALILGIVGLYGVCSYLVAQRTKEIGIRMALGARQATVTSMILSNGLELALVGIVIGLAASIAATRLLRSFLYGVSPSDPMTLTLVSLLLLTISALATLLPARRAAGIDPLTAVRSEQ